jgi:hypothetical protein
MEDTLNVIVAVVIIIVAVVALVVHVHARAPDNLLVGYVPKPHS